MQKLLSLRTLFTALVAVAAAAMLGMNLADELSPPQPRPVVKLERVVVQGQRTAAVQLPRVVVQASRSAGKQQSALATQLRADNPAC
ncbi:hypothetical protein HNP55_001238 [Paucibacter oligotrophus]|uniref:Uncharacterized protein n=1 Tax=Roseateles oligotrophus TaxID=1769250 RepID=A0A840L7H0_9BURK|nr:hypothetical protein [Roseateles oligotrophus]MBB4842723.1 hypothetical protein [Roseateles oligotrophus]